MRKKGTGVRALVCAVAMLLAATCFVGPALAGEKIVIKAGHVLAPASRRTSR